MTFPLPPAASSHPQSRNACVLLVDDDELVLRSLRRALSGQGWTLLTASSAEQALRELAAHRVDIVMSDMQMHSMSGAALLGAVQEQHPEVVRIIISGHADPKHALKALPFAHQFLPKPIETDLLRWTIRRAWGLRQLLTNPTIEGALGASEELLAAPATYVKVLQLLRVPEASAAEVAAVVEEDAGLSTRVLELAGIAYLGPPGRVTTMAAAVSHLGLQPLRALVLHLEVARMFQDVSRVPGLSVEALQRHALATARLSHSIASEHAPEDAWVAGLMHSFGKLVLAGRTPERYAEVVRRASAENRPLLDVEREVLGANHAEVGSYLLGLWGLPQRIVEAVTHHGEPARLDTTRLGLAGAVYVASVLASDADAPLSPSGDGASGPWLDAPYLESTGALSGLPAWRALARDAQR